MNYLQSKTNTWKFFIGTTLAVSASLSGCGGGGVITAAKQSRSPRLSLRKVHGLVVQTQAVNKFPRSYWKMAPHGPTPAHQAAMGLLSTPCTKVH
jgi:hypothetical protein